MPQFFRFFSLLLSYLCPYFLPVVLLGSVYWLEFSFFHLCSTPDMYDLLVLIYPLLLTFWILCTFYCLWAWLHLFWLVLTWSFALTFCFWFSTLTPILECSHQPLLWALGPKSFPRTASFLYQFPFFCFILTLALLILDPIFAPMTHCHV